jgi:hypothetical protein
VRRVCWAVLAACLASCATDVARMSWRDREIRELKERAVGHVGCPAGEMTLSDLPPVERSIATWTLECRGQRFLCSQDGRSVACHEPLPGEAGPRNAAPEATPPETPKGADRRSSEWKARRRAADAVDWP